MGEILIGTASWTDKTLIESGRFYPRTTTSANWGYEVSHRQHSFARRLIDAGAADLVHGHSAHHPGAIEIYRGRQATAGSSSNEPRPTCR